MPEALSDLIILGAGPTGLYAAFCAGLRNLSVTLVDSLPVLGGQLVTLYPEKLIFDVPGHPQILSADLAEMLIRQARRFNPDIRLNCSLDRWYYDKSCRAFTVHTSAGRLQTRAILITAGIGALSPRPLKLAAASRYSGNIHYFLDDPARFAGQRVLVVGGTYPAVRWALDLLPHASSVMLVHRRQQLHAPAGMLDQLRQSRVVLCLDHEITDIDGPERLEIAHLKCMSDSSMMPILADQLLIATAYHSTLGSMRNWNLDVQGSSIVVDTTMRTSHPGIWAAGDIVTSVHKLKLLVTNFAEASLAVNHIKVYLDPAARLFPGHSSDNPQLTTTNV